MRYLNSVMKLWVNLPLAIKGVVVVAVPLAILLTSVVSLYFASMVEAQAEDDVRATFAIQNDIHEVHALLAEAAGGMRGYLLTGQQRFLEPYFKAEAEMPRTIQRLIGCYLPHPRVRTLSAPALTAPMIIAQVVSSISSLRAPPRWISSPAAIVRPRPISVSFIA